MRRPIRQCAAAYGLLLLLLLGIGVASATLCKFAPSPVGTFHFKNGELERDSEVRLLNPLLDIKLRILADYPVEKLVHALDKDIQQANDPETLRSVYYKLFLLSDWSEIKQLLAAVAGNKSFALQVDNPHIPSLVDLLDSTILSAAYLYERLGMKEAAAYFYALYLDCLRPIGFSSPGASDHLLGKRLMISRVKYYYLKEYVRFESPNYAAASYLNWIMEERLQWMIDHRLAGYRKALGALHFPDLPRLVDLIHNSDKHLRQFLDYERCISVIYLSTWSQNVTDQAVDEACSPATPAARDDYFASFASAAYIFHQIRRHAAKTADGGVADPTELGQIELAAKAFYERHAKEAEFLVDDMKVKFAAIAGSEGARNRTLCELSSSKYPFPQYDFAPYASKMIREGGIKCD